jgi:dienelactone hydrolase
MLHELPMVFISDGVPLAGTFVRNSASLSARQRCVVVTGSWLTVKEQMALVYARALAQRGFAAFTYDFCGWGASDGALRHWELPTQKARDMVAAVDFVSSLSFAGPKVGYLAVCASAQYALRAAAGSARLASLVTVAGWFHDATSVAPFYGGEAASHGASSAPATPRRISPQRQAPHGARLRARRRTRWNVLRFGLLREPVARRGEGVEQPDDRDELAELAHLRRTRGGSVGLNADAVDSQRGLRVSGQREDRARAVGGQETARLD